MTPARKKKLRTPPSRNLWGAVEPPAEGKTAARAKGKPKPAAKPARGKAVSPANAKKRAPQRAAAPAADEDQLPLRPYARLLTMLGDQLIRNERVALVELLKNAYDADASWVKVTFEGFDDHFRSTTHSRIVIEDDGLGMDEHTIREHWANPATPVKAQAKSGGHRTSPGGRVIQGEKGIGRFALLKLGRTIKVTTRAAKAPEERTFTLDLAPFDTDFMVGKKPMFLDKLRISLRKTDPATEIVREAMKLGARRFKRRPQGTRIEISNLTSTWSPEKVEAAYQDMARLQSIFALGPQDKKRRERDPFELVIYRDNREEAFGEEHREKLEVLLDTKPVFRIHGAFDDAKREFNFTLNKQSVRLKLDAPELKTLAVYKKAFGPNGEELGRRDVECGPFGFAFYVFDFSQGLTTKHAMDKEDRNLVRDHRIYLYRDGIRVYPYGDPDDDWLQIDQRRGTFRAAEFLSSDQVTGYVTISQQDNPDLRDKTSREGLVDTGHPTEDFVGLLQILLAWVRAKPYAKYRLRQKDKHDVTVYKQQRVQGAFDELRKHADQLPATVRETLDRAEQDYKTERRYLVQRAESTESLAGVGLSVESASHDLHVAMNTALKTLDTLRSAALRGGQLEAEDVLRELVAIRGSLAIVQDQLKDMQLLFKSTKQKRRDVRVQEIVEKVERLFKSMLDRAKITVEIEPQGTSPLMVKTTDAVLLQLFLNLFDNAIHWLGTQPPNKARRIEIVLNSDTQQLIFADNGPGISPGDEDYIFEPFYSSKGEEGRGLGLYIARQLLERQDFTIELAAKRNRVLPGANFVVNFAEVSE